MLRDNRRAGVQADKSASSTIRKRIGRASEADFSAPIVVRAEFPLLSGGHSRTKLPSSPHLIPDLELPAETTWLPSVQMLRPQGTSALRSVVQFGARAAGEATCPNVSYIPWLVRQPRCFSPVPSWLRISHWSSKPSRRRLP